MPKESDLFGGPTEIILIEAFSIPSLPFIVSLFMGLKYSSSSDSTNKTRENLRLAWFKKLMKPKFVFVVIQQIKVQVINSLVAYRWKM